MDESPLKTLEIAWIKDQKPDIVVLDYKFFPSPRDCCAQTALPFWGKLIGTIKNNRYDEVMLKVVVYLLDDDGNVLDRETDIFIVEGLGEGKFEVNFKKCDKTIKKYSIELHEVDEESFTQSFL
ncbi:MAG: hypothetical protein N2745_11330 [Syntrophorhabdaceae bacterium]|nr:hypothetical protein [Syntrophorhabdaceae bacterium]